MVLHYNQRRRTKRMWAGTWLGLTVWACLSPIIHTPTDCFFTSDSGDSGQEMGDVVGAINKIVQALDSHERHIALYERVSKLEENLNKKTENEMKLESEVQELRTKIPLLEAEIQTIPEMRKDLAEFEAKIEKLVHDYEAKLSTLASEVIRLKKNGARRKDLQTLSDGSDNVLLRIDAPCPEVGLGMAAERIGDQCLYFSWGTPLNWTDAHRHCQSLGGDLSAPEDLLPLKTFLHRAFARGPSIWLGASYNLDDTPNANVTNNTIGGKSPVEDDTDGGFSFSLNILGSPDVINNRIDDDAEGDEDSQDDEPSSIVLSDGIALRDEAIAPNGELLGNIGSLSRRFFGRNRLFSASAKRALHLKLQESSLTPVVDFILLKDPVRSDEDMEVSEESSQPTTDLPSEGSLPAESNPALSTELTDGSPLDTPGGGITSGLFRDVREVLEDTSGQKESATSEHREEETKNTGKAKMNCMLLQQKESLEYELIGQPCNEEHRFVCEILTSKNPERKFSPDNLLHE